MCVALTFLNTYRLFCPWLLSPGFPWAFIGLFGDVSSVRSTTQSCWWCGAWNWCGVCNLIFVFFRWIRFGLGPAGLGPAGLGPAGPGTAGLGAAGWLPMLDQKGLVVGLFWNRLFFFLPLESWAGGVIKQNALFKVNYYLKLLICLHSVSSTCFLGYFKKYGCVYIFQIDKRHLDIDEYEQFISESIQKL